MKTTIKYEDIPILEAEDLEKRFKDIISEVFEILGDSVNFDAALLASSARSEWTLKVMLYSIFHDEYNDKSLNLDGFDFIGVSKLREHYRFSYDWLIYEINDIAGVPKEYAKICVDNWLIRVAVSLGSDIELGNLINDLIRQIRDDLWPLCKLRRINSWIHDDKKISLKSDREKLMVIQNHEERKAIKRSLRFDPSKINFCNEYYDED